MRITRRALLEWGPRLVGVAVVLFVASFALDAFSGDGPFWAEAFGFLIHLAPALLLLAVVTVAWRFAWVGAVMFIGLAALYAAAAAGHLAWILIIAGPMALAGALYLLSWLALRGDAAHHL